MPDIPAGVEVKDLSGEARVGWGERVRNAVNALQGRRPFGPGLPAATMMPTTPIISSEGTKDERALMPRQWQYPVGVNLNLQPRREQPALLTSFEQLRNLAALYDVAAMCIAARMEEMQGMDWSVAPKDKRREAEFRDECDAAMEFFEQPDKLNDFFGWMGMLLYELFTTDALTLYKRPDKGGRLYALEAVDGSTIKPLLDERGRTLAYQQIVYGMAENSYRRPSADEPDEQLPVIQEFTNQQLIYRPRWTRTFTPYGFPPTEWIILRVNTALRKQTFDLRWFTDGNIPDMIATPPDGSLNPEQVQQFETWFNAVLTGDDAARRKVRFVPWNMNMTMMKQFSYETALDDWMLRVTCAAYSVPPQELGFTYDVNKATAEMQEAVNERRGLKPLANWLKKTIFDPIIRNDLGYLWGSTNETNGERMRSLPGQPTRPAMKPQIEWQWHYGDRTDEAVQAQSDQAYYSMGVISADELRTMRFGDALDGKAPGAPGGGVGTLESSNVGALGNRDTGMGAHAGAPQQGETFGSSQRAAAKAELRLWRGKAEKAVKTGKSAAVSWESQVIPAETLQNVSGKLAKAQTIEDVRDAFAAQEVAAQDFFRDPEGWEGYG